MFRKMQLRGDLGENQIGLLRVFRLMENKSKIDRV